MSEIDILEILKDFASGNTLVLLYIAVNITRYILYPLYKGGKTIKALAEAATKSLNSGDEGHRLIATELQALSVILKETTKKQ